MNEVQVLSCDERCPRLPLVEGSGDAQAIIWPGVGASMRSMHRFELGAAAQTKIQSHPMEAVYYVITGSGMAVDPGGGAADPIAQGSMVHIDPGTAYRFEAGPEGMVLLGGPCPVDPAPYAHLAGN